MSVNNSIVLLASVALFCCVLAKFFLASLRRYGGNRLPYPPGPQPKFLIGNVLDLPTSRSGPVFAEWSKKYHSDILFVTALGTDIVVVNNRAIAEDLFEKRARLYNDRPQVPTLSLCGMEYNMAFLRYGERWRQHRKLAQENFNATAARRYHPIQIERVHNFLRGVLDKPVKIFDHNKMLSVSLSLLMMYGYEPTALDDPVIHLAEESLLLSLPLMASLMHFLPILGRIPSWLPGAKSQKMAKYVRDITAKVKSLPRDHAENAVRDGTAAPSFVTNFLEKKATEGASDDEYELVNNVAWTTYAAASDTMISVVAAFLHLILIHPDVQRKAQAEIDRVVGNDRLPDFKDRGSLPYVEAIYREVMRLRPVVAFIPHALTEDDVYEGHFIPKGANVLGNIWAMTRDESIYSEPEAFRPERFLDANGKINNDNRVLTFGFGRRVCVGQHVASSSVFLTIVSFLACFDITPAKDDFGNEIPIDHEYEDHFIILQKKPFQCSINPRNEQIRRLIEATANK